MKQKGFTIIELLVVIAIIGLLASIGLVAVTSARQKAAIASGNQFAAYLDRSFGADAAGMWNLNEGSGTTVSDSAGNNKGTISGSYTWIAGSNSTSTVLSLNGPSNGTVGFGNGTAFDVSEFTIAMWVKVNAFNGPWPDNNVIMARESYLVSGFRIGYDGNGYVNFWSTESIPGGGFSVISSKPIGTDRFYHVAVSYSFSAKKASIYIDGQLSGTSSGNYVVPVGRGIGLNTGTGGVTYSNAQFYNVRFYTQSTLSFLLPNSFIVVAELPPTDLPRQFWLLKS